MIENNLFDIWTGNTLELLIVSVVDNLEPSFENRETPLLIHLDKENIVLFEENSKIVVAMYHFDDVMVGVLRGELMVMDEVV